MGLLVSHLIARYTGPISFCCVPVPLFVGAVIGIFWCAAGMGVGASRRSVVVAIAGIVVLISFQIWTISWSNTRLRAEMEHGMRLPPSAHHFQCRGDALTTVLDRAAITWFEINPVDLKPFLARLKPSSNVPPFGAGLSNEQYTGQRQTWVGTAKFNQVLQCESPVGDFLIVEVWDLPNGGHLIKMYTDWN